LVIVGVSLTWQGVEEVLFTTLLAFVVAGNGRHGLKYALPQRPFPGAGCFSTAC
jgi:hypothetical protein